MLRGTPGKPGTWQARVFLAYASEDGDVALAVKGAIENYAKRKAPGKVLVIAWEVNNELTKSILDNVRNTMREREFGVFIYSPIDGADGADGADAKARDNVVFESGLFIGMKEADRAIILLPENYQVAPSDLDGILGLTYSYAELQATEEHLARVGIMSGIGAVIVDRICAIMAQPPPYQEQPDPGQLQSGARTEQPLTAAETYSRGLTSLAALSKLTPVAEDISAGRIVVHAIYGIGRVMGFDPEGADPRYVDVQFGSVIGRYKITELFDAPIGL
jgi:hypothetical protein